MFRILVFALLMMPYLSYGQLKYDYNWMFGISELNPSIQDGYRIDFNGSERTNIKYNSKFDMSYGTAAISDPQTGELLFYTNGCEIRDASHQLIENGDELQTGNNASVCRNTKMYSSHGNLMILPDMYYDGGYYILYRDFYLAMPHFRDLRFTYVDMNANNGDGTVTMKREVVYDSLNIDGSVLNATLHANGKDWLVSSASLLSEDHLVMSIIDADGPRLLRQQKIETALNTQGVCTFTPQGDTYICFDSYAGLTLYDFDNSTGLFSNYRFYDPLPIFSTITSFVSVSASGQYAYFGSNEVLFQMDLSTEQYVKIADVNTDIGEEKDQSFGHMARGPDCRIYIAPRYESDVFHVIHHPDRPGLECDFRQYDYKMSILRNSGSLPNVPAFSSNPNEVCDQTITGIVDNIRQGDISIYPNPASDYIKITATNTRLGRILDLSGRQMLDFKQDRNEVSIDISDLSSGLYIIQMESDQGKLSNHKLLIK